MSDVLSADEVLRLDIDFDPDGDWAKAEESWAALARSHEQLRGERDAARETVQNMGEWLEESEAAARAGGCAADALRKIEDLLDSPRGAEPFVRGQCISLAREALDAYDQTGQTGAMTVLDFDKGEARVEPFSTAGTVATFTGSGAGPSSAGGCAVDQLNALYDEVCSALDVLVGDTIAKTQADRISRALQILNDALAAVSGQTAEKEEA